MKINYKILPLSIALMSVFTGCGDSKDISELAPKIDELKFEETVELSYAEQFSIDRYEDGYSLIHTMNNESFLIVPKGKAVPENLDEDITVIPQSVDNIYLTATSAMGLFSELDCGETIKFSGTKSDDWYIDYAVEAMEKGKMLYAGKYREPDYELLMTNNCELSIQSTMIEHSPEVKDKLEELGIPVFTDCSSYESHPLGRSEWIKVYGEIMGKSEYAEQLFNEQADKLKSLEDAESTRKTAVFFHISTSGQVVTRKSGDYVTKMIELAGGKNIFDKLGDSKKDTSSVTMEMEKFYSEAKDADFIIYNSNVSGEVNSVDELIGKNELLADFKAVKNGNVWCTKKNLFQETMKFGTVISDFHIIFNNDTENHTPEFLFRLEGGNS